MVLTEIPPNLLQSAWLETINTQDIQDNLKGELSKECLKKKSMKKSIEHLKVQIMLSRECQILWFDR